MKRDAATRRCSILIALTLAIACSQDRAAQSEAPADSAPAADSAAGPRIVPTLTPASGTPGTTVTLTANGLPAGATIEIGFGAPQENFEVLAQGIVVDPQGNLSAPVKVPTWAVAGREYRFVVAVVNQPPLGMSGVFNVTSP